MTTKFSSLCSYWIPLLVLVPALTYAESDAYGQETTSEVFTTFGLVSLPTARYPAKASQELVTLSQLPPALGPVEVTVSVTGDYAWTTEYLNIDVSNGQKLVELFKEFPTSHGRRRDCVPRTQTKVFSDSSFIDDSTLEFQLHPSAEVHLFCPKNEIKVTLSYVAELPPPSPMCGDRTIAAGEMCYSAMQYSLGNQGIHNGHTSSEAADLNGDGRLDVVTSGEAVFVSFGDAAEVFAPPVEYEVEGESAAMALEDVNNDDILDIVRLTKESGTVAVLLGDGLGGFHSPVYTRTSVIWRPKSTRRAGLGLADFNLDGNVDLVTTTGGKDQPLLLFWGRGDGTFQENPKDIGEPLGLGGPVIVGDWNGDGNVDIAVGDTGAVLIYSGDKSGDFSTISTKYPLRASPHGIDSRTPSAIVATDLNGDHLLDLVTANGNHNGGSHLLINQGNRLLVSSPEQFAPPTLLPREYTSFDVLAEDLDADGKDDLVFLHLGGWLSVWRNDGNGAFPSPTFLPKILDTNRFAQGRIFAATDIDGNGTLDILGQSGLGNTIATMLLDDQQHILNTSPVVETEHKPSELRAVDINGDGTQDILSCGGLVGKVGGTFEVLINDGEGSIVAVAPQGIDQCSGDDVFVQDVTGDGWPDLVDAAGSVIRMFVGRGDGTFAPVLELNSPRYISTMTLGDFDNDGIVDIVTAHSDGLRVFRGLGMGAFAIPSLEDKQEIDSGSRARLVSADFDQDGFLDLVFYNRVGGSDNRLTMRFGNGSGGFPMEQILQADEDDLPLTVQDMNGDGMVDIVSNEFVILNSHQNSPRTFSEAILWSTGGTRFYPVHAMDLNHDGNMDLVTNGDGAVVTLGAGDGAHSRLPRWVTGSKSSVFIDVNGDGALDSVHTTRDGVQIFFANP